MMPAWRAKQDNRSCESTGFWYFALWVWRHEFDIHTAAVSAWPTSSTWKAQGLAGHKDTVTNFLFFSYIGRNTTSEICTGHFML